MLPRRALAACHFELNDCKGIPVAQHWLERLQPWEMWVVSSYVRAVASAAAIQPSAAALEAGLMEQEQHYPYPVVALP